MNKIFLFIFISLISTSIYAYYLPDTTKPECCFEINATLQEQNKLFINILNKRDTCCTITVINTKTCDECTSTNKDNNKDWLVAIIALIGTLIASFIAAYISRKNTERTLKSSRQIEIEKKELEKELGFKLYLKEIVAKFINKATILNGMLNHIIYRDLEDGNVELARDGYKATQNVRDELKDIYYSIKVSLDGSIKQKELEAILDQYMSITCLNFDLEETSSTMYSKPLAELFHKARAIIHDNYIEPKL